MFAQFGRTSRKQGVITSTNLREVIEPSKNTSTQYKESSDMESGGISGVMCDLRHFSVGLDIL